MIESTFRDFLEEKLNVSTYLEHEKNMPKEYIMIEKTGGSSSNFISSATIAIQSISSTMAKASKLNEKVKTLLLLETPKSVSSCKLNSDYNFTDTETKQYRYQAVYDITHYE